MEISLDVNIDFRNKLGHYATMPEECAAGVRRIAEEAAAKLQFEAPKGKLEGNGKYREREPGRLERSFFTDDSDPRHVKIRWNAHNDAPHWEYIEYGSPRHDMTNVSFYGHKGPRFGPMRINAPNIVNHPGNAPRPFIQPIAQWAVNELHPLLHQIMREIR